MTLCQLKALFAAAGCTTLYAKCLAGNDNSKNQVYFGPNFLALNLFPNEGIISDDSNENPIFKAKLRFGWLLSDGNIANAPAAQLILYPQYPEVRFSGFLKGCIHPPSELMASRLPGRILFLGVIGQSEVIGFVVGPDTQIAKEFLAHLPQSSVGIFLQLPLRGGFDDVGSRAKLLQELRRINKLGWVNSKQLDRHGALRPCNAPQCGGFTLEAELGIAKNSNAEPDFLGWEVKQHTVSNFDRPMSGSAITLMTPEPTGGYYEQHGPEEFVRRFGYADRMGRVDRLNFGGIHKVGQRQALTGLTLRIRGYDAAKGKITEATGEIALVSDRGDIAASWAFSGLLAHWSKKHAKAVYIPSLCRILPARQYAYGPKVRLAIGTDSLRLLEAFAIGSIYYDPGIKLENASTRPVVKRRSQFRIASRNISALYERVDLVDVLTDG